MGIFISSATGFQNVNSVLKESLQIDPKTIMDLDLQASNLAAKVTPQESQNVLWRRLIFAGLFLVVVLLCGIWTAQNGLEEWSKVLLHSFELLLGLLLGLLGGEAAKK